MRVAITVIGLSAAILTASAAQATPPGEIPRGQILRGQILRGQAIFQNRCAICHDDSQHMLNDVGPALFGVVNRRVGSVQGYRYSPVLKTAGQHGDRWTIERLDRLLTEPTSAYYGTSMPAAIASAADRRAMLAYLKTLRPTD